MKSEHKTLALIVLVVLVIWGYASLSNKGAKAPTDGPVKVGFIGPLTGDSASYGESIKRGVQLGELEFAKDHDGFDEIELVFEDSKCDADEAVKAVNKLISVDNVVAIIGESCSSATLAAASVADEAGVALVSAASTSPDLSDVGNHFYRTIPSDALQGAFGAELVRQDGHEKLAMLYSNEDYGLGFSGVLEGKFAELGGELVASEVFERNATDVRAQLRRIRATNPDAIYIISNSLTSSIAALTQLRELGITAALYGSEGMHYSDLIAGAGDAANGLRITAVSGGTEAFRDAHEAEFGSAPGLFAAQGYDAYVAIAVAVNKGARTAEDVIALLPETRMDGASGTIIFDAYGDVSGNYDVFEVVDGAFVAR